MVEISAPLFPRMRFFTPFFLQKHTVVLVVIVEAYVQDFPVIT